MYTSSEWVPKCSQSTNKFQVTFLACCCTTELRLNLQKILRLELHSTLMPNTHSEKSFITISVPHMYTMLWTSKKIHTLGFRKWGKGFFLYKECPSNSIKIEPLETVEAANGVFHIMGTKHMLNSLKSTNVCSLCYIKSIQKKLNAEKCWNMGVNRSVHSALKPSSVPTSVLFLFSPKTDFQLVQWRCTCTKLISGLSTLAFTITISAILWLHLIGTISFTWEENSIFSLLFFNCLN